jgi:hypothetical protein
MIKNVNLEMITNVKMEMITKNNDIKSDYKEGKI